MATTHNVHWAVPTLATASLFSGVALALGHHLFYASLNGTSAPTGDFDIAGTRLSRQQFNTAVGTAFAFLVKSLLALAVTVAYTQAFWRAVNTSRKGQTLSTLDTLHSILDNLVGFVKLRVWWRHPLLVFLAVIAW